MNGCNYKDEINGYAAVKYLVGIFAKT